MRENQKTDIGRPLYTSDIWSENALEVAVLRMPYPHFEIDHIDIGQARLLEGVDCVLAPGDFKKLRDEDIAVVAGQNKEVVQRAISLIEVGYDRKKVRLKKDKVASNLCEELDGELLLEKSYSSEKRRFFSLETPRAYSYMDCHQRIVVVSPTERLREVQRELSEMLGVRSNKLRLIRPKMAGGFKGRGKLEAEYYAALVTLKTGKPSRIEYSFEETATLSSERKTLAVDTKLSCDRSGKLKYLEMKVRRKYSSQDEGGVTCSELDISKLARAYGIDDFIGTKEDGLDLELRDISFALEMAVGEIGEKLRMGPVEIRKKNSASNWGLESFLDRVKSRMSEVKSESPFQSSEVAKGRGLGISVQDMDIDEEDSATATIKLIEDGSFTLLVDTRYLGSGMDKMFEKICAEAIGVKVDLITLITSDTDISSFGAGGYSGKTIYATAKAIEAAGKSMKKKLSERAANYLGVRENEVILNGNTANCPIRGEGVSLSKLGKYLVNTLDQIYVCESYSGKKPGSSYSAVLSDVEIDQDTGELKVNRLHGIFDLGKVVDKKLARTQMEGAMARSLENTVAKGNREGDLGLPFNRLDIPDIEVEILDSEEEMKEYNLDAEVVTSSVREAIYDAIGISLDDFPVEAEQIYRGLKSSNI